MFLYFFRYFNSVHEITVVEFIFLVRFDIFANTWTKMCWLISAESARLVGRWLANSWVWWTWREKTRLLRSKVQTDGTNPWTELSSNYYPKFSLGSTWYKPLPYYPKFRMIRVSMDILVMLINSCKILLFKVKYVLRLTYHNRGFLPIFYHGAYMKLALFYTYYDRQKIAPEKG